MSAPFGDGQGRPASVHAVAADALASLLAQGETWPPSAPQRFRNLLLDACGSDHRALIDLLLRVGRHGLVDALHALGTVRTSEWPARRTTLVSMVVGELFVNADIATWAVDAWAVALGVVPRDAANALRAEYAARAASASARVERVTTPRARSSSGARGTPTPGVKAPTAAATYVPGAPSWAGGPPAPRVGAWVRGAPAAGAPRWRVPGAGAGAASASGSTIHPPNFAGFFVAMCVFGVFFLGFVMTARSMSEPIASAAQVALRAVDSALLTAPGASVDATTVATDSSARGADSAAAVVDSAARTVDSAARTVDSAPRVVADMAAARQPVNAEGAPVLSAEAYHTTPMNAPVPSLAGRYRVERRILAVNGSAMCTPVADALQNADAVSDEEFTQTADTREFQLVSRPGVHGMLQGDGTFATAPHSGTHDGVRYNFRMIGRTTPTGFVARTYTETEAVIRYRRTQRCMVIADLIGARR